MIEETNKARMYFDSLGLQYKDITMNDLYHLISILNKHIYGDDILIMMNEPILRGKNKNVFLDKDNRVVSAFLKVKGAYFKEREGISFNEDGFIGFCGWGDAKRTAIFTDGFKEWCDYLSQKLVSKC